jgi:hypothetical protein
MGEGAEPDVRPQPPTTDDPSAWRAYWERLGQPWRTEPEIEKGRQEGLESLRATPSFKNVTLSRGDVEWLLATHEAPWTGPTSSSVIAGD